VTTAPLLLLLSNWPRVIRSLGQRPWPRIAIQIGAMMLTLYVIFGLGWADEYQLFYLLFLPLIWIVMSHAIVGAALGIAVIQLGLMATVRISGYKAAAVLEFEFLMLALAATGLFLGMFVTERRTAREALDRSESRLRAMVSTAPDSIVTVDMQGVVVAANPAALRIFNFLAGGLIGTRVNDVLPEFERVARIGEVTEVIAIRRDGSRFAAELAVGTTGGAAPELRIAIARDISRRKEIERQLGEKQAELNRSARLAAAGEMAAALAHELHQPLSAIRNYAHAALILASAPGTSDLMQKVEREAARAAEIVQRLRDFFRGGASRLERVGVSRLIEDALEPMREEATRHHVILDIGIANHNIDLLVDRVQVETVIHSLVGNAIDAIAAANAGERHIRVTAHDAQDGRVRCSVADTGPGISPEIADRLFEPFATTKPTGIGLGLAMSRSMIEAHGGELWTERGAGGGTVFHFSLPLADSKEATHAAH
jgi:two-component system sensor kinase FixL